ncbi:MAG: preprotein translocase subunit YajC [Gammaproteobacteria bacterium]
MHFLISDAWAAGGGGTPAAGGSSWTFILLMVVLFVGFYFLLIRPQQKRQKQHRQMVEQIGTGDEVVTNGGMLGRVTELGEQFVGIEVSKGVEIRVQKNAIGTVLPKGTIKHG